jgi:hypothetical protein
VREYVISVYEDDGDDGETIWSMPMEAGHGYVVGVWTVVEGQQKALVNAERFTVPTFTA